MPRLVLTRLDHNIHRAFPFELQPSLIFREIHDRTSLHSLGVSEREHTRLCSSCCIHTMPLDTFVKNKSENNARPSSANSTRRAEAAQARVTVPSGFGNERPQMHNGPLRGHGQRPNVLPPASQHNQRQVPVDAQHGTFDTDVGSSVDTTIHDDSGFPNQGGMQQMQQRQIVMRSGQASAGNPDEEDQESSEKDDGSEEEYDEAEYQEEYQHQVPGVREYRDEAGDVLEAGGFWPGEGDSYPSTSEPPGEHAFRESLKQQVQIDRGDYDDLNERHQPPTNGKTNRNTQPTFQHARPPAAAPSNMVKSVYERNNAIKMSEKQAKMPSEMPRGDVQQINNAVPSQLPGHSRAHPHAFSQPNGGLGQQSMPLPAKRSAPPPKPVAITDPAPMPARTANPQMQRLINDEPVHLHQSIEEDAPYEPESPIVDYDSNELFNMDYDKLRCEDFDTEPRRKSETVLNEVPTGSLKERLAHVQKNLNPDEKDQFFRALPTREWEDAGDWFLDRFGDIISRAKEARQKKRKVAREFEDEVEKRYRKVAKKQQIVEKALDEMKEKGQDLIPKSPSASRTPRPAKK